SAMLCLVLFLSSPLSLSFPPLCSSFFCLQRCSCSYFRTFCHHSISPLCGSDGSVTSRGLCYFCSFCRSYAFFELKWGKCMIHRGL
uniref:Secreted protein n=1 Tax=Chelydra serpentina TaxID=8475 RepID=A0A8C3XRU1_CHESE